MHRIALVVVGVAAALALAASAAAQSVPRELRVVECAADALSILTESNPNPRIPAYGLGLAAWFLGCSPDPTPAALPILNATRSDVEMLHQYGEELPDLRQELRSVVCGAWWAIYTNEYQWALYQGGSDLVGSLPTPADRWADCERWIGIDSTRGR